MNLDSDKAFEFRRHKNIVRLNTPKTLPSTFKGKDERVYYVRYLLQ